MHFSERKSATKFLSMNIVSNSVVRHSLTYLSVQKFLVGDVSFYIKIWLKLTHPLRKRRFMQFVLLSSFLLFFVASMLPPVSLKTIYMYRDLQLILTVLASCLL